jgi:hypothetical protein
MLSNIVNSKFDNTLAEEERTRFKKPEELRKQWHELKKKFLWNYRNILAEMGFSEEEIRTNGEKIWCLKLAEYINWYFSNTEHLMSGNGPVELSGGKMAQPRKHSKTRKSKSKSKSKSK